MPNEKWLRDMIMDSVINSMIKNEFGQENFSYRKLEWDPRIKTVVTDEDLILAQIDYALDSGNEEMFMMITNHLKAANGSFVHEALEGENIG